MKVCSKCKIEKPFSEFNKAADKKGGLRSNCKGCCSEYSAANREKRAAYDAAYRKENKARLAAQGASYYYANLERISAHRAKYRSKIKENLAAYHAAYRAANRLRIAEYAASYYAENRDKVADRCALYRAENRENISARAAKYHADNQERIAARKAGYRAANRDKIAAKSAEYAKANPDKIATNSRNRRARKRSAEGSHTAADVCAIFEKQSGLCANCEAKLFKSGTKKYHVDHIMPLALGGSNWPSNLQCLCPACNMSKGAKHPDEWAKQQGRLL